MINDARCTSEIKSRIAIAQAAFNKKTPSTIKIGLNIRRKLTKCYTHSTAETWTLGKTDQKRLGSFGMWW